MIGDPNILAEIPEKFPYSQVHLPLIAINSRPSSLTPILVHPNGNGFDEGQGTKKVLHPDQFGDGSTPHLPFAHGGSVCWCV